MQLDKEVLNRIETFFRNNLIPMTLYYRIVLFLDAVISLIRTANSFVLITISTVGERIATSIIE
jgi:hypothetical protein